MGHFLPKHQPVCLTTISLSFVYILIREHFCSQAYEYLFESALKSVWKVPAYYRRVCNHDNNL